MSRVTGNKGTGRRRVGAICILAVLTYLAGGDAADAQDASSRAQRIVQDGFAVEYSVEPLNENLQFLAGENARVRFTVTDAVWKTPAKNLRLMSWMSLREGEHAPDATQCKQKVQTFLAASLSSRPDVDLNSYYILALNKEPNISVINPGAATSKLLSLVPLISRGADWVLTSDQRLLFVSMPLVNKVAAIDLSTWKVANIDVGAAPGRLRLQPQEKTLWVAFDGPGQSGVTAISVSELKKVGDVPTGTGSHELSFNRDGSKLFATNRGNATVSVVDTRRLVKTRSLKVGSNPVSVEHSASEDTLFVASETDGTVLVIDTQHEEIRARVSTKTGLSQIRLAPGGRYLFAANPSQKSLFVIDTTTNKVAHTLSLDHPPSQIGFTETYAYIRSEASELVTMVRLSSLGRELETSRFPAGASSPQSAGSLADQLVRTPESNAVIVSNSADKMIYYYTEGMAAPMGSFTNYKREPTAVMIVDFSLREISPGIYSTTFKPPRPGVYDVALLIESPRILHCFEARVAPNPAVAELKQPGLRVEYLTRETAIKVKMETKVRLKVFDRSTNLPKTGLTDLRTLVFLAPGIWQTRDNAREIGDGVYEMSFVPPNPGQYMVFVESASAGVKFRDLPSLTLQASE